MTVTDDSVWATTPEQVLRLDAQDGRIVAAIPYGGGGLSPVAIAHSPGAVWVAGVVTHRMDPQSNTIAQTYEDSEAESVSFGRGFLWATHVGESLIIRIDPQTNEVAHLLPPWEEDLPLGGVAAGPEGVWVVSSYRTVARVDGK